MANFISKQNGILGQYEETVERPGHQLTMRSALNGPDVWAPMGDGLEKPTEEP